jgi:CRISPR-associated protein Csm1
MSAFSIDPSHIVPYGLLCDLSRYSGQPRLALPDSIPVDAALFDRYLEQAERWVLHGEAVAYDPQQPQALAVLAECLSLAHDPDYQQQGYTFPFRAMGLAEEDLMPRQEAGQPAHVDQLWADFAREYQTVVALCGSNPATFTETLVFLLKKYTSCLPAGSSEALRPVALYEFLKLRASLAHCLLRVQQSEEQPDFPVLLFCADLSGIQDFVYNIVRTKALKALKGRSFYLQLLLDSLLQQLIDDPVIDISLAHVVYNSGGKMYVLLPHLTAVQDQIARLKQKLDEQMWDKHHERLTIHMAWIPFRYTQANVLEMETEAKATKPLSGGMGELWDALRRKTGQQKYQAFQGVMAAQYGDFFEPIDEGLEEGNDTQRALCAITGELIEFHPKDKRRRAVRLDDDEDAERIYVSPTVGAHAKLGYYLKNVIHYNTSLDGKNQGEVAVFTSPNQIRNQFKRAPEVTDEYFRQDAQSLETVGLPSFRHSRVRYLNDTDFLNQQDVIKKVQASSAYGFSFYGGNEPAFQIDEQGQPIRWRGHNDRFKEKETHQLAGQEGDEATGSGFHRLGVLRMDVDNLGRMFQEGLTNHSFLAAYATLSAQLDWFFGGYLNTLRDQERYRDWVNILYSGGDDLFLFGKWDRCIEMARDIRAAFKRFMAHRPGLTLSGGLAMIEPKFPFSKGAEWAGEAEGQAKKHPGKDAFHLLGQTVQWGEEFDFVLAQSQQIKGFMQRKQLTKGFIYKLYALQRLKRQGHTDWIWMVVYTFSQYANQTRNGELYDYFHAMKDMIFTGRIWLDDHQTVAHDIPEPGRVLDLFVLAANWAELQLRT